MHLSVIIPTYNEAENLSELILLLDNNLSKVDYEIIIIDDNSPDKTGDVAEKLSKKYPVKVVHRNKRLGLSTAVISGFNIAKGDFLCVMDADLSHPPEKIPEMMKCLKREEADIIIASRIVKGGGMEKWPLFRKFMSFCARCLVWPLTSLKDPLSGFFIININVIKNVQLNPLGYKILLEILVKGEYEKAVEYPFIFKDRVRGKTKLDGKTVFQYFVHVARLYYYSLIPKKNEQFFKK